MQALTDSTVYFMDVTRVKRLAQEDAAVALVLAEECVHRLCDVLEELAGNAFATVQQRVVRHLLDLAASSRPATGVSRLWSTSRNSPTASARFARSWRASSTSFASRHWFGPRRAVEILDPLKLSLELWSRTA